MASGVVENAKQQCRVPLADMPSVQETLLLVDEAPRSDRRAEFFNQPLPHASADATPGHDINPASTATECQTAEGDTADEQSGSFHLGEVDLSEKFPWSKDFYLYIAHAHADIAISFLRNLEEIFHGKMRKISLLRMVSNETGRLKIYISYVDPFNPIEVVARAPVADGGIGSAILDTIRAAEAASVNEKKTAENTVSQEELKDGDVTVLPAASLLALDELIAGADKEAAQRLKRLDLKIRTEGAYLAKPLAKVSGPSAIDEINPERFPNFAEFFAFLRAQCALAALGGTPGPLRLPPILLLGDPGIGKTAVLWRLAKAVRTGFLVQNLASAQIGASLSGSDIYWSNSRPGALFDAVVFGKTANPIVLLDELDKVIRVERDPIGSLYTLLERQSAASFCDLALPGVNFDASHVVWFAAANSAQSIDPAILSRFKVFKIPVPNREQMSVVLQSIYSDLRDSQPWGQHFEQQLSQDVIDMLCGVSPRDARIVLEDACGQAALAGRNRIETNDVTCGTRRNPIGFAGLS